MNPIDLLPIKRPLEDDKKYDDTYFYDNVIKPLIPDIIKIESNGIPIDLNKVKELDNTVNTVINNVKKELSSNPIILDFLKNKNNDKIKEKELLLENKKKTYKDYLKPFSLSNKIHRTYLINTYLTETNRQDMIMDEWSIKELKRLNSLIASKFIDDIINKKDISYNQSLINEAMIKLATDKANLYNKNTLETKKEKIKNSIFINEFNPSSSTQIRELFAFYGIESENTTPTNNDKWDRDELEKLSKLLDTIIEDKE